MPFTQKGNAAYYDCDASGRIRISALLRSLQQIATDHLQVLDLSYEKLFRENKVFLLAQTCVQVEKMPLAGEDFQLVTVPVGIKGPRFIRDIVINDLGGNRMVSAVTTWMLVDPSTRRILRPKAFGYKLPYGASISEEYVEEKDFPDISLVVPDYQVDYPIVYSHIDNNGHVNNSFYLDFACNIIPDNLVSEVGIRYVKVHYQNEALVGDVICLKRYDYNRENFYIVGTVEGQACFQVLLCIG